MVKAKDLLEKSPQDPEKDQDDEINEAYESLSKKLEALRKDSPEDSSASGEAGSEQDEEKKEKGVEEETEDELDSSEKPVLSEAEGSESSKPEEETLDDLAKEEPIPQLGNASRSQYFSETSPLPESSNVFNSKYDGLTRPKGTSKLHIFILVLLGLAIIGGTVYLLRTQFSQEPTPTPIPEAVVVTPTPEPTPPIERSKIKVRILNGTTKTGLAASVSAKLKGLGYQSEKVGNATNSAFERTVVRVKSGTAGLLDQLIKDLTPDFDATTSTELKDQDQADAEVILGTK